MRKLAKHSKQPTKQQLDSLKPVQINNLYDIRKVVQDFAPHEPPKDIVKTSMKINGTNVQVQAPVTCDQYSMFMEGMNMLKSRQEVIDRHGDQATNIIKMNAPTWVDNIIVKKLGGKRDGLRVRWDLKDGTFFFDPFTGKLTQAVK